MLDSKLSRVNGVKLVIRSASRRRTFVLAVEQLALTLALILGAGILMLLLGTQILDWYWPVLLGSAGFVLALFRIRARMLSPYCVAQLLDRRLQLSDSLSTAWFLLSQPNRTDNAVARFQIEQAERLAATVKPVSAFPWVGGRLWALTGALAAVAFGLFAVRYLVTSSLNLQQALIPIHFGQVLERIERSLSSDKQQQRLERAALTQQKQPSPQQVDPQPNDAHTGQPGSEESQPGKPDDTGSSTRSPLQETDSQDGKNAQKGQTQARDGSVPDAPSPTQAQSTDSESSDRPGTQQVSNTREPTGTREPSSGLMDRMKDALSSFMTKMRSAASSQNSAQKQDQVSETAKGRDQASAGKDQNGQAQQDASNERASQEQSAAGEAVGQTAEKAQTSQGRNSDQSTDKKSSAAQSGIGRQDGDKSIKDAEQLQAMGKLAEIIGKRSASVTGDMTVETPSGKQELKTAYSQRLGRHSDLGGEINRDEIPLDYQQYIREYMEQVHKQTKSQ